MNDSFKFLFIYSSTAAKGSAMSTVVIEDDDIKHGKDDTDIMAMLRIRRDRD